MTAMFFLRTPYAVIMFIRPVTRFSDRTGAGLLTLMLTAISRRLGAAGIFWAVFCLTAAIGVETLFLRHFAARHAWQLPAETPCRAGARFFRFP